MHFCDGMRISVSRFKKTSIHVSRLCGYDSCCVSIDLQLIEINIFCCIGLCVANGGIRYEFVCRFQYLLALIFYFLLGQCSYDRAIAIRNSLCSWILVDVQPTLIAKTTEITLAIKSHIIAI